MAIFITATCLFLFFIGIHLLLCDLLPVPSRAARAAVMTYKKKPKFNFNTACEPLAKMLLKYIHIGKYKRMRLEKTLRSAHIDISPELYLARAIAPAIVFGIITVPIALLIHPIVSAVFLFVSFSRYSKEAKKAEKKAKKVREGIESELPHFAGTIAEELKKGRDVLAMLTAYSKVCGKDFQVELNITIAEMQTGNYQDAISRFYSRVDSPGLTQICRSLLSALDGHDQTVSIQIIQQTLENAQDQRIERNIQSLYNKIKPYSLMLLGCMFLLIVVAVGIYLYQSTISM